MRYIYCCLYCCTVFTTTTLLGAEPSATTSTRPAPRKPFVSKASTTASSRASLPVAPQPAAVSSGNTTGFVNTNSGGSQAEILVIRRSNKPPSIRPAASNQGPAPASSAPAEPISTASPASGSGTQAQFGRIIERQ